MPDTEKIKRGYLKEDFRFAHLKDQQNLQFEYHYHDFDKIIVFISGNVTYLIEGRAYRLEPWDILLVRNEEIHKPIIDPNEAYERIVIWVNPSFLQEHSSSDCDLLTCFRLAAEEGSNLLRPGPEMLQNVKSIISQLKDSWKSTGFGSRILCNALFIQLVVHINREMLGSKSRNKKDYVQYDERIAAILDYINSHLDGDLSIDSLASMFYMSKYNLMHKFKKQTGYSIHSYIQQKRLIMAHSLIKSGKPATEVCVECGFGDYSSFVRAFKKMFGLSPKKYYKSLR